MLAKKLMVRPGSRVAVLGAPPTIDLVLANGAVPSERGPADIVLLYTRDRAALARALPKAVKRVADGGVLWVAYPKAGQLGTDADEEDGIRQEEDDQEALGGVAVRSPRSFRVIWRSPSPDALSAHASFWSSVLVGRSARRGLRSSARRLHDRKGGAG